LHYRHEIIFALITVSTNRVRRGRAALPLLTAPNGTLARQTDRVFADLRGPEAGVPD
jgi:hypothetical protein